MKNNFFTITDQVYIAIFLISTVVGTFRGVTREILSVASWFGAGFLSTLIAPYGYPFFEQYIKSKQLVQCISFATTYISILIILLIISSSISRKVKESALSGLDRAVGAIFGIFRAALLILSIYLLILMFKLPETALPYIRTAKMSYFFADVAENIMPFLEDTGLIDHINSIRGDTQSIAEKATEHACDTAMAIAIKNAKPRDNSDDYDHNPKNKYKRKHTNEENPFSKPLIERKKDKIHPNINEPKRKKPMREIIEYS